MAVFILPAHQDDGVDEPPFFYFLIFSYLVQSRREMVVSGRLSSCLYTN